MTAQPCPDCGTLMGGCYDPLDQNEEPCYACPNCGNTWTVEEIAQAYIEWGIVESEDKTDG